MSTHRHRITHDTYFMRASSLPFCAHTLTHKHTPPCTRTRTATRPRPQQLTLSPSSMRTRAATRPRPPQLTFSRLRASPLAHSRAQGRALSAAIASQQGLAWSRNVESHAACQRRQHQDAARPLPEDLIMNAPPYWRATPALSFTWVLVTGSDAGHSSYTATTSGTGSGCRSAARRS